MLMVHLVKISYYLNELEYRKILVFMSLVTTQWSLFYFSMKKYNTSERPKNWYQLVKLKFRGES